MEIKEARRLAGLSQSQAAKAWDIPVRTLQTWEQSQASPRGLALKTLRSIIDPILNVEASTPSASSVSPVEATPPPAPKPKRMAKKPGA